MFNSNAEFVINQLIAGGYDSRFVGGCVRDFVLGLKPSDIDIATVAKPSEVISIFDKSNIKIIPTGIQHGTVMVILGSSNYEITTLRKDIKCYGRQADVLFTKSFEEDSKRRDFTFNALYMDVFGRIYDFHNGINDLENKKVRFIGDPALRIKEDYLRILRYYRFLSKFPEVIENYEYTEIITGLSGNLAHISKPRIHDEFIKILATKNAFLILKLMEKTNVLEKLLEYDLSKAENDLFDNLPSIGKLSVINKSTDIKEKLAMSNKEMKLLKFYQTRMKL